MTGKFDFRQYINMFRCCIGNDRTYIVFGVITAIGFRSSFRKIFAVFSIPPLPPVGFGTESGIRSQFRIFIHLDTPSSCIRQVKMQIIQLIKGHHVQQFEYFFFRKEMTRHIQVHPSVLEPRLILYGDIRDSLGRKQLTECLFAIEQTCPGGCFQVDTLFIHYKLVSFRISTY